MHPSVGPCHRPDPVFSSQVKLGIAPSTCGNFITPRGPIVLTRGGSTVVGVQLGPGSGRVHGVGGIRGTAEESAQVAATFVGANFLRLKGVIPGVDKKRRTLMSQVQDLLFSMVHSDNEKEGPSAGACIAFCLLQVLGMELVGIVAITGTLDLRGRIESVGDVMEKVQAAQNHQVRCELFMLSPVSSSGFLRRVDQPHQAALLTLLASPSAGTGGGCSCFCSPEADRGGLCGLARAPQGVRPHHGARSGTFVDVMEAAIPGTEDTGGGEAGGRSFIQRRPAGFAAPSSLAAALDGPHVGVGWSFGRRSWERYGVQCCLRRPGRGDVILTGNVTHVMRDAATVAKDFVARSAQAIGERLGLGTAAASLQLLTPKQDLHLHMDYGWAAMSSQQYTSVFVVAMTSMMLQRRPSEDVAIIGHIAPGGTLFALSAYDSETEAWGTPDLADCFCQGFRQMVISGRTVLPEKTKELAARPALKDGQCAMVFHPVVNVLDALPALRAGGGL
jgi:hypothetical protein